MKAILGALLVAIIGATEAFACSYSRPDYIDMAENESRPIVDELVSKSYSINMGYLKLVPTNKLLYSNTNTKRPAARIVFTSIETLKGKKSANFDLRQTHFLSSESDYGLFPNPRFVNAKTAKDFKKIDRVLQDIANRGHDDFDFWDRAAPGLKPQASFDTILTSCGPAPAAMWALGLKYIAFRDAKGALIHLEPYTDATSDLFVTTVRAKLENPGFDTRRSITPIEFLNASDGFALIRVGRCDDSANRATPHADLSAEIHRDPAYVGWRESTLDDLFFQFWSWARAHSCAPGQQFVAFLRDWHNAYNAEIIGRQTLLFWRYARIENGRIRMDDIPTQYNFQPEPYLDLNAALEFSQERFFVRKNVGR